MGVAESGALLSLSALGAKVSGLMLYTQYWLPVHQILLHITVVSIVLCLGINDNPFDDNTISAGDRQWDNKLTILWDKFSLSFTIFILCFLFVYFLFLLSTARPTLRGLLGSASAAVASCHWPLWLGL